MASVANISCISSSRLALSCLSLFVQRMFVEGLNALNIAMGDALKDVSLPVGNNHVFLNVIPPVEVDPNYVDACLKNLARRYSDRLRRLRVSQVLARIRVVGATRTATLLLLLCPSMCVAPCTKQLARSLL